MYLSKHQIVFLQNQKYICGCVFIIFFSPLLIYLLLKLIPQHLPGLNGILDILRYFSKTLLVMMKLMIYIDEQWVHDMQNKLQFELFEKSRKIKILHIHRNIYHHPERKTARY